MHFDIKKTIYMKNTFVIIGLFSLQIMVLSEDGRTLECGRFLVAWYGH